MYDVIAGLHYSLNFNAANEAFFKATIRNVKTLLQDCLNRVKFIVSGVNANSAEISLQRPLQSHETLVAYNLEMKKFFSRVINPEVMLLDFYNLSIDAVNANRTSDGVHFLTGTCIRLSCYNDV